MNAVFAPQHKSRTQLLSSTLPHLQDRIALAIVQEAVLLPSPPSTTPRKASFPADLMEGAKQGLELLSTVLDAAPIPEPFKSAVKGIPDIVLQILTIVEAVKGNVSGSHDTTLRLWNATTGAPIGGAMQGHSHSVTSVAV
ncbi:hypothetical protein FRB96_008572, partial [Tulasnella sp. 330]